MPICARDNKIYIQKEIGREKDASWGGGGVSHKDTILISSSIWSTFVCGYPVMELPDEI
jgi:hypothetical protein